MDFSRPFGGLIPGARGAVLQTLMRTGVPLTGRQLHSLISDRHSLSATQSAIADLSRLGLVSVEPVGSAKVVRIDADHYMLGPLRTLLDPIGVLADTIAEFVDDQLEAVILFGSVARGEATADSDIDLAVIAEPTWSRGTDLQDLVARRFGNSCDVIEFTADDLLGSTEPVAADIRRDGVALVGSMPLSRREVPA